MSVPSGSDGMTEKVKPKLHCWEDAPGGGATCMLERDHDGSHEFTPDSQIVVRFPEAKQYCVECEAPVAPGVSYCLRCLVLKGADE